MYTDYNEEDNEIYGSYTNDSGKPDKEKIKRIAFFVGIFAVLLLLIILIAKACSTPDNSGKSGTETLSISIGLSRESISLAKDSEERIYADVLMSKKEKPVVSWYSNDTNVATVSENGTITAKGVGTTSIIAVYSEDGKVYSNKCEVTVTETEKGTSVEEINFTQENINLPLGKSTILQISITPSDANVGNLIFKSNDTTIVTVDAAGYATGVSVGTTTIIVSTEDGTISDKINITVTTDGNIVINPVTIQLTTPSNSLVVGGTIKAYAMISPSNATNTNLTWNSTNKSVATVSSNGTITGISVGKATIVVSTNNNLSATLEVNVASNVTNVTGIVINEGTTVTLEVGGTKKINSTIYPTNATNRGVTYSSSDESVAVIDSSGLIGALKAGTAVITARSADQGKTAIMTVTVKEIPADTSGGGNSSGGSSTCSSLTAQDMMVIGKSTSGIVSSYSYDNATWISNNITFTINEISSCLKKLEYLSNSSGSYLTMKVGSSFTYSVNGKTTISFRGTKEDGTTLTKKYYIKLDTFKPTVSITILGDVEGKNLLQVKVGISDLTSGVNTGSVKYCYTLKSSSSTSCTPSIAKASSSFTVTVPKNTSYFCVAAKDNGGREENKCTKFS